METQYETEKEAEVVTIDTEPENPIVVVDPLPTLPPPPAPAPTQQHNQPTSIESPIEQPCTTFDEPEQKEPPKDDLLVSSSTSVTSTNKITCSSSTQPTQLQQVTQQSQPQPTPPAPPPPIPPPPPPPQQQQSVQPSTTSAADFFLQSDDPMIGGGVSSGGGAGLPGGCTETDHKREDRIIAVPTGFKCLVCRRIFPTELEGLKHVKSSHSKTYSCPQCGRTFNNKANMKRHALIKHSGEVDKKFQCTICGRRYAIKQSLRYHLESKHNQGMEGDEDEHLQKINEHDECTSNHNHDHNGQHPTNSLTGLEEALEELRRYEDDDAIEYYPNSTRDYPSTSQATTATTTSTATPSTSSVHPIVDPLSAYLNPPPLPTAHSSTTIQSSQHSAMYAIPHSPGQFI